MLAMTDMTRPVLRQAEPLTQEHPVDTCFDDAVRGRRPEGRRNRLISAARQFDEREDRIGPALHGRAR